MDNIYKLVKIDAQTAHKKKIITYDQAGIVTLRLDKTNLKIDLDHQFPMIFATFSDLNKALSRLATSPKLKGEKSLREKFDQEFKLYRDLVSQTVIKKGWEPDYGTYFFDHLTGNLFLVAPEFWHRLGLVTSSGKLLTDEKNNLVWNDIRKKFDSAVIGFVGASVGGNIIEGALREIRPKRIKIADPDWEEITNLNRLERGSLRHLVASRARKIDKKNPYELVRVNKAELTAYEHSLVDPYLESYIYTNGVSLNNLKQFILGKKGAEPPIDILVEEADNLSLKFEIRKICRQYKIPVLMLSDFGHRVQVQFQDFKSYPKLTLGYKTNDLKLEKALQLVMSSGGNRKDLFHFIRLMCGEDFAADEFKNWVEGKDEQPTSSLPQSGATALAAGGIGGKILAWYLLGYKLPERFIIDFRARKIIL